MKRLYKRIAYIIVYGYIGLSVMASCTARADWYGMAGQSKYTLAGTGSWYIDELPHTIKDKSFSWSIGYRGDNWRAGYVDLGRMTIDGLAYYPDVAYKPGAHLGCAEKGCAPANRYIGSFAVSGLFATYEPKLGIISLGIGPAILRHRYRERVIMTAGENPYVAGIQIAQDFNYNFTCSNCADQTRFTYVLTLGIEGEHLFFNAQFFPNAFSTDGAFKGITVAYVGYKF